MPANDTIHDAVVSALRKDGWTVTTIDGKLSAHFEHTIAITGNGPRILTKLED